MQGICLCLKFRGKEGWDLKRKKLGGGWGGVAIPAVHQRYHQLSKDQGLKTAVIYKIIKRIIWREKEVLFSSAVILVFRDRGKVNYRHGHDITASSVLRCPLLHKGCGVCQSPVAPIPPPLGPCSAQQCQSQDHWLWTRGKDCMITNSFLLRNPLPLSFSAFTLQSRQGFLEPTTDW